MSSVRSPRSRGDLCPGVLRPWPAEDGLLVRLRLVGGHLSGRQLADLLEVSSRFGDGAVHLTKRANLQVRALGPGPALAPEVVDGFARTGLLPSPTHELVRNILMSPQSGYGGGRADLRPIAAELDRRLLSEERLAGLPGRFLFVLDDGRGDLIDRHSDLGIVAIDAERGQLRVGRQWGEVVPLADAAVRLASLALAFIARRGSGPSAPWHVRELEGRLVEDLPPHPDLPAAAEPPGYGRVLGGTHHEVVDGVLDSVTAAPFLTEPVLVVTPWHGVFVPQTTEQP